MLLFAMCLSVNMFFCSIYNPWDILDKVDIVENGLISEHIDDNEDNPNPTNANASLLNKINSYNEGIVMADIPKSLLFFLFYFLFFTLFFYCLMSGH